MYISKLMIQILTKKTLYWCWGYWPLSTQWDIRIVIPIGCVVTLDFAKICCLYFIHLIVLLWYFKPPFISLQMPFFSVPGICLYEPCTSSSFLAVSLPGLFFLFLTICCMMNYIQQETLPAGSNGCFSGPPASVHAQISQWHYFSHTINALFR